MKDLASKPVLRALLGVATGCLLAVAPPIPSWAVPPVVVETHVTLRVGALLVEGGRSRDAAPAQEAEAGPALPAKITLKIPWGPAGSEATVVFEGTLGETPSEGDAIVHCAATVTPPDAPSVRARRDMQIGEEGSGLFEVYGDPTRRILLTVKGEKFRRPVVRSLVQVGDPVRILVAVERLDGERAVPLETNELHTFVGQSVEYSFRRGGEASLESVRLTILPLSIVDDLVSLQIEVNGALPGAGGSTLISHNERIVASRRATSSVTATSGVPPAGYRFQVTPDF